MSCCNQHVSVMFQALHGGTPTASGQHPGTFQPTVPPFSGLSGVSRAACFACFTFKAHFLRSPLCSPCKARAPSFCASPSMCRQPSRNQTVLADRSPAYVLISDRPDGSFYASAQLGRGGQLCGWTPREQARGSGCMLEMINTLC